MQGRYIYYATFLNHYIHHNHSRVCHESTHSNPKIIVSNHWEEAVAFIYVIGATFLPVFKISQRLVKVHLVLLSVVAIYTDVVIEQCLIEYIGYMDAILNRVIFAGSNGIAKLSLV